MINLPDTQGNSASHFEANKSMIIHFIDLVISEDGIKATKKRKAQKMETDLRDYLNWLKLKDHLKKLIITEPADLPKMIQSVYKQIPSLADTTKNTNEIMNYLFIQCCYKELDKWEFVDRIKVDTCVYCNRNYIYYLTRDKKVKPQLDHFYPKSKYPFLGMSYYNLIPSCQTCNGFDCKNERDPLDTASILVNPYLIDSDDFQFDFTILSADYLKAINSSAYQVSIKRHPSEHVAIFKLDGLYARHTDHVAELVLKASLKYSAKYRAYLKIGYKHMSLSDHEINRMIIGNYTPKTELHKRPLSKLYLDIANDLGLIDP